jgi:glycosyltransferase involved in cell wall biosynthesis
VKILHVIASLDPRGGGPMEGIRQISQAAQEWGQQTTVLTLDAPGQPYHEGNPFRVVALGPGVTGYGYSPRVAPWLREHAGEFDAVVVNGIWQYSSFAVWRALHGGPVPYFVFPHGMLDPYFKRAFPLKHLKKWLYWPWAEYRVLRDARAVLFTCEEERLLAHQSFWLYRCREEVVGYGTAPSPYARAEALAAFHAAYPALRDQRILLFLSRIHGKKGCDLLIDAYARLVREGRAGDDVLVIAGPGEPGLLKALRERASGAGVADRIVWTGMLSGAAKWGALHAADAFVLPSHQENFGIAVVEALACGTPVLISDKVNIWREILADGAGLVGTDTAQGSHELLQRWHALGASERQAMRECAAASFRQRFHVSPVARALTRTIEQLRSSDVSTGTPLATRAG